MRMPAITWKSELDRLSDYDEAIKEIREEYEFRKSSVERNNMTSGTDWVVYSVLKPLVERTTKAGESQT